MIKKIIILLILCIFLYGCNEEVSQFDNKTHMELCETRCIEKNNISCQTSFYEAGIVTCYCDDAIRFYYENLTEVESI